MTTNHAKSTDFEKAKTSIVEGVHDSINTWFTKKGISKISLLEWKTTEIKQIDNDIVQLKNKSAFYKASTNSPGNHQFRKTLANLH